MRKRLVIAGRTTQMTDTRTAHRPVAGTLTGTAVRSATAGASTRQDRSRRGATATRTDWAGFLMTRETDGVLAHANPSLPKASLAP